MRETHTHLRQLANMLITHTHTHRITNTESTRPKRPSSKGRPNSLVNNSASEDELESNFEVEPDHRENMSMRTHQGPEQPIIQSPTPSPTPLTTHVPEQE